MTRIPITRTLAIYEHELREAFVTAGGPGGQHVNKVATAVQLRFSLPNSSLPDRVKIRAGDLAGSRLNREGEIVLTASAHSSQSRNREDARARLIELLKQAAAPPPPKRRPTRPTKGSVKRRLDGKTKRGATKRLRGRVEPD